MTRQTIAITGATGFIGRVVVRQLLEHGRQVVALVRETSPRDVLGEHPALSFVEYEDLDSTELADVLREHAPDAFLHAGWAGVSGGARRQVDQVGINVHATRSSVELASAAGCQRWVGVGSQAEYGASDAVLDEQSPLKPASSYARAKVQAAESAREAAAMFGLPIAWARLFSVYGPGDHHTAVVPTTIRALLDGSDPQLGACAQDWDLLYVEDAAAALVALLDSDVSGDFNVASGLQQPLRESLELIAELLDRPGALTFAAPTSKEPAPLRAHSAKLQSLTGWAPTTSLRDGLAATLESHGAAV